MLEKELLNYPLLTFAWVAALSMLGGIAQYVRKINGENIKKFSVVEFIGELFVSGFAGLMTFFLCDAAGIDVRLTAVFVGVSGHAGSRAIFMIENYLKTKAEAMSR